MAVQADYGGNDLYVNNVYTGNTAPAQFVKNTGVTETNTSATPGTVGAVTGAMTTGVSLTSGNLVGTRGSITVTDSTTVGSGVYLYGTQGKLSSGTGTISAGSGHIAAVYGQLDMTGGTVTSGHVAAVIADIFAVGTGGAYIDNYYAEQTTGTANNSVLKAIVNSTYLFDLSDASNSKWDLATKPSTLVGCFKVSSAANGGAVYIPLYSSPTGGS